MTAQKPNTAPQEGDYDALRQRVVNAVHTIHPGDAQTLAAPERSAIIRVASEGVLRQLQEQGVREAGTLAIRLGEAAETDDLADLSYTVAERYEKAQSMRVSGGDANTHAQQQRMALLSRAAGETAAAVASSVLNPDNLTSSVNSGREAVLEYRSVAHTEAGGKLLNSLLKQIETRAA